MAREQSTEFWYEGKAYDISFISLPNIDDLVITEAQVYVAALTSGAVDSTRRVDRTTRDYLVRYGVSR